MHIEMSYIYIFIRFFRLMENNAYDNCVFFIRIFFDALSFQVYLVKAKKTKYVEEIDKNK